MDQNPISWAALPKYTVDQSGGGETDREANVCSKMHLSPSSTNDTVPYPLPTFAPVTVAV